MTWDQENWCGVRKGKGGETGREGERMEMESDGNGGVSRKGGGTHPSTHHIFIIHPFTRLAHNFGATSPRVHNAAYGCVGPKRTRQDEPSGDLGAEWLIET